MKLTELYIDDWNNQFINIYSSGFDIFEDDKRRRFCWTKTSELYLGKNELS